MKKKGVTGQEINSAAVNVVHVIDSSSYFGSGGGMAAGWDGPANVAERGEKFAFLPWKEAATPLSSKGAPTCIPAGWVSKSVLFLCPRIHRGNVFWKGEK